MLEADTGAGVRLTLTLDVFKYKHLDLILQV